MNELTGKRALVTGSKSGIGFAIAKRLAKAGAELVLHARANSSEVEEAKTSLAKLATADISTVFGDFSDQNSCRSIFETIKKENKPIDILINNASNDQRHTLEEITEKYWDERMAINLKHYLFAIQTVKKSMVKKITNKRISNSRRLWSYSQISKLVIYRKML